MKSEQRVGHGGEGKRDMEGFKSWDATGCGMKLQKSMSVDLSSEKCLQTVTGLSPAGRDTFFVYSFWWHTEKRLGF